VRSDGQYDMDGGEIGSDITSAAAALLLISRILGGLVMD
jgi:hypothetical protein